MSNEFEREERYIVFKMPDLGNSLKGDEIRRLAREYAEHLEQFVKKPLDYVVVGAGWSEYSPALRVIEVHVTGAQPAPTVAEQGQINAEAAIRSIYDARLSDEALWQTIGNGMITPAHIAQVVVEGTITPAYIMHPAPNVPEGFSREDLEAVADGLDGYEKTVNVGNVTGEGDEHLESTTAYAARFIRAMLAAPEAKS